MGQKKPVAIVLGGIFPHAEVVRKLKNRGYYTVLIDYFENPPAAKWADEHCRESNMDYELVLEIAREKGAELVVSPCLDQQMVIAMKVAEALNLSHPFSSEVAMNVTNKKYMKKIMMENQIPTAKYYQVGPEEDLSDLALDYPVMVKPTDGCGAAGVCRIYEPEELKEAVVRACGWSRSGEAIVEEFKTGIEVSAYTFIHNFEATLVTTQQRVSVLGKSDVKCFCGVSPSDVSEDIRERLEKIATQIARAFGLDNTPLFYQAIVKDNDISVIEFAPRLGGGSCFELMKSNAKFDMLEASIDSYLGKEVVPAVQKEESVYLVHQVYGTEGIFDHVEGYQELLEDGTLDKIYFHKMPGMEITREKASSARVALLMIKEQDIWKCIDKLGTIFEQIKVLDTQGRDITDRSLCLSSESLKGN